jgi:hypothetical protein
LENAKFPMLVAPSDMVTFVKPVLPEKAESGIATPD